MGKINSSYISKTIAIEGRINKVYPIKAKLIEEAFRCKAFEHITLVQQDLTDKLIKPFSQQDPALGKKPDHLEFSNIYGFLEKPQD